MASYTKTFYLTVKADKNTPVSTQTATIDTRKDIYVNALYFNKSEFPWRKTVTKVELRFYRTNGTWISFTIKYGTMQWPDSYDSWFDYNMQSGWNTAIKTLDYKLYLSYSSGYDPYVALSASPDGMHDYTAYLTDIYTHNSPYKPYIVMTYEDTAPFAPGKLTPTTGTFDRNSVIRFAWEHRSREETSQAGFTLQYSSNNESTWSTVTQNTANQYYNMPAGTLPANKVINWRVKTKDKNGLESGYTSAAFTTNPAAPLAPTSLYPSGASIDTRSILKFSWAHKSQEATSQKAFTLEYSIDSGVNWTTVSQTTSNEYYNLAADILPPNKGIQWRVKTKDTNDLESTFSSTSFNTGSVPPLTPTLVSPLSRYLDGTMPIVFNWDFIGGTAEDTQGKYDLEYSLDKGSTWTKITTVSSITQHTIAENTFQSSNIYWRVKIYNTYGDASPYSVIGSFFVINIPPIPQIQSVTNSSRPTIQWISVEQQGYELEILDSNKIVFKTGKIHAPSDRSYKVNKFLDDGNYLARLRVANEYNLSSPWAEYNFTIETIKPDKPQINVFSGEYSVTLRSNNSDHLTLVYRDNILIGELTNGIFTDYTGENGKYYKYFIRIVDAEDNFADSELKMARCKFKGNTIALANVPEEYLKLRYGLDSIPKKANAFSTQGSLVYYDGRPYPVAEHSEFKSKTKTVSLILKTKKEVDKLLEFINSRETLIYRDADGENIYGAIFSLDYEKNILGYYQIGFTILRIDYKDVVYD